MRSVITRLQCSFNGNSSDGKINDFTRNGFILAVLLWTAKEIRLKHQAPVISMCVIDRNAVPLPAPFEVENECARPPDMTGAHSVVICSEEQLKVAGWCGQIDNPFKSSV